MQFKNGQLIIAQGVMGGEGGRGGGGDGVSKLVSAPITEAFC